MKPQLVALSVLATALLSPCLADEADALRDELAEARREIAKLERRCALQAEHIKKISATVSDPAALDRIRRLAVHSADRNKCLNCLKNIAVAKQLWAEQSKAGPRSPVTMDDLAPHLAGVDHLKCLGGGVYHLRAVGKLVRCSIHGPWPEKEDPNQTGGR